MTATDLASVIVAFVALGITALAVVLLMSMRRTADELLVALARMNDEVDETLRRLDDQTTAVDAELHRVDGLVASAERVSARADTLSRMTYGAVARPVIRTAAVVKGTSRAARRLRGGRGVDVEEQPIRAVD